MRSLKFQTRLTVVYLALFLAVQGIIVLFFYNSVTKNVREQVQGQLGASARVFERIINERVVDLGGRAQDLSRDFGFKQAIATGDAPTINSALQNLASRIDADLALIYDTENEIVGGKQTIILQNGGPTVSDELKDKAEQDGFASTITEINGKIYELVVVPVMAPVPVAWIALGLEFDRIAALEIKSLSPIDLEIAFLYQQDNAYMVASSTSNATSLNDFLSAKMNANLATVFNATFNNEDHMFWRLGLVERGEETSEISALLYFSMDRAFKPYVSLAVTLSIILLVGLLFLVGGSVVLSRGIARPLQKLARATGRIASGEYAEVEASSSDDEISALTTSFNQMIAAVKEREEKIVFQSCHDAETGLKNRNHFEIILSEEVANNDKFIIMIAEVPQLTEFRGVLDHGYINKLLTAVGQRLEQAAGAPVARVSADAFCLILKDDKNMETLPALVMNSFLIPFDVAGIKIDTGVKLGLTKYPDDSKDPAKLMQYVNSALDLARSSPKGVAWYVADRSEDFKNRLSMMSDLRDGIENGEVTFAYQAKFDLAAGKITTVEALVRWNSSTRGFVPPDDFIPFAERTGDVRHITDWGLREAVSQCAKWRKKGIDLTVAVNLSTSDLMNQNLPAQVLALLTEYALPATSLKLEVTESAVMHDMNRALDVLNMLSAMGMELSIDDYGTGYSSLSYLKKLPVNELKIDKSFVLNLSESEEDRILVRSTVELGHNLGLSITAEGVEDIESVNMLREYGCDVLQGYFISRPLAAADFEKFYNETKFDWA